MSNTVFTTKVTGLGGSALAFLGERMLIFFNKQAQADLAEYSVLIDDLSGQGAFEVGNTLTLGDHSYKVTAVGEVANTNFSNLGHVVVHFDGATCASLPGTIHVEALDMPQITVGMPIGLIK